VVAIGLSAQFVRTAKPGRYCDGDGLYLLVRKSGALLGVPLQGQRLQAQGSWARSSRRRSQRRSAWLRPEKGLPFSSDRSKVALTHCWPKKPRRERQRPTRKMRRSSELHSGTRRSVSLTVTRLHGGTQSTWRNGPRRSGLTPTPYSEIFLSLTLSQLMYSRRSSRFG
jgi:hypothetical protein